MSRPALGPGRAKGAQMKKAHPRKLTLHRESLRTLEPSHLIAAKGNSDLCTGPSCLYTCTHHTREATCTC